MKIQVNKQSQCCGSYYRNVDNDKHFCNLCGSECEVVREKIDSGFLRARTGRMWSKKKHLYLTAKEVSTGEIEG